jgi:tripartite-type tricarboxylate transporter receptor subunit TctC
MPDRIVLVHDDPEFAENAEPPPPGDTGSTLERSHLPAHIANLAEFAGTRKANQVPVLATLGPIRSKFAPEVPTFRESGVDIVAPGWFGFYAPAKVPHDAVDQLSRAIATALQVPEVASKITGMGFVITGTTPAELDRIQRAEAAAWLPRIRAANFNPEQ